MTQNRSKMPNDKNNNSLTTLDAQSRSSQPSPTTSRSSTFSSSSSLTSPPPTSSTTSSSSSSLTPPPPTSSTTSSSSSSLTPSPHPHRTPPSPHRPPLTPSGGSQHLNDLVKNHPLPRAVVADPASLADLDLTDSSTFDLGQPLLLYQKRSVRKATAHSLVYDSEAGDFRAVGHELLIPIDYNGYLAVLGDPTNCHKDHVVPYYSQVGKLAISTCCTFLIGGDTPLDAMMMEGGMSATPRPTPCRLLPGDVLRKGGIFETTVQLPGKKKMFKKTIPEVRKEHFLHCWDDKDREILIPQRMEGVFYILTQEGKPLRSPVVTMRQLLERYSLPQVVRLLHGKIPPSQCGFTGTLMVTESGRDRTVIASTLFANSPVHVELPINSRLQFSPLEHHAGLLASKAYSSAMAFCNRNAEPYSRNIKINYGARPQDEKGSTSTSNSTEAKTLPLRYLHDRESSNVSLTGSDFGSLGDPTQAVIMTTADHSFNENNQEPSRASTESDFSRRSWVGMTNVVSVDDGDHPVYVPFSHSKPFFKLKTSQSIKSKYRDVPGNLKEGSVKRLLTYQKPEDDSARGSTHQCCVACDGSCSTSATFSCNVDSNYQQMNEDTEQNIYAAADEDNVYDVTWTGSNCGKCSLGNINHGSSNDTACLVKADNELNVQPGEGNYVLMDSADPQRTSTPSLILKGEFSPSEQMFLRNENDQKPNESSTDTVSSFREAPSYYLPTHTAPRVPSSRPLASWSDAEQPNTSTLEVNRLVNISTDNGPRSFSKPSYFKHGSRSSDYMNVYDEPRQVSASAIADNAATLLPDNYNRMSTISKNHEYETLSNHSFGCQERNVSHCNKPAETVNEYTYIKNTPSYTNRDIIFDSQSKSVISSHTNKPVHSTPQYQEPDVLWPPSKSKTLTLDITNKVEDRVRSPDLDSGIGLAEESTCDNAHYCEMDIQQNVAASNTDDSILSELQQRFHQIQSKSEDVPEFDCVYDIPRSSLTLVEPPNVTETYVCDTSNRQSLLGPKSTTPEQSEETILSNRKYLPGTAYPSNSSWCPRIVDEKFTANNTLNIERTNTTQNYSSEPVLNGLSTRQSLILNQIDNSRELKKTTKSAIGELNQDIKAQLFNENNEVEQLQSLLPSVGKLELNKLRCLLSKK